MATIIDHKLRLNRKAQLTHRLRNNSGGTVNAGAVVVFDTSVTDAFTTTTSQDSPLVAGVCLDTVADGAYADVLWLGFTDLLKVNGTTDIAKGDYLTTFTVAGIAAKRTATTAAGVFAIALEAYATNDSNGVIDAWIVPVSRVAGATSAWADDVLLQLGADNDIAQVLRSTALNANTTLAGVVEGTAATLATAANSLIIANITNDGDIHLIVSKGGNSHTALLADGSTGDTILNAATGQSVDLFVAGTKEYDFSATIADFSDNALDNVGYIILNAATAPAGTEVYWVNDNAGDATINALTGKKVLLAVAGTDVVDVAGTAITLRQAVTVSTGGITVTGNSTITGDLNVTGSLTFGGNWTVGATLTVDELVLDTDGVAPAGTVNYLVNDNTGDTTANVLTGKQFIVAVNNTDEYTFSATILDMLANALDNCGFIILNAATAPAATEVYLVNDNTGDLTANALSGKDFIVAIAGVDEVKFDDAAHIFNDASNDRDFRVESGGMAYAIYSDGGKDALVFGSNTDTSVVDQLITISRAARTATANTNYYDLAVQPAGAVTVPAGTTAVVASMSLSEPNITATGTVTNAATLHIASAPTEGGTGNYGIMVSAGDIGLIADAEDIVIGAGRDVLHRWSTADADNHAYAIGLGASNAIHIAQGADIAVDWNVAAYTHPTLVVHSATTPATDYVSLSHSGTIATLNVEGATTIEINFAGGTEIQITTTMLNLRSNILQGNDSAGGDLTLRSTSDATKGTVTIADGEQGIKIGAVTDRATTEQTNGLVLFNGTAPVGTLANGITIYSTGGECYIMDAGGTATLQTQHTKDGDYAIIYYSSVKNKTVRIGLEKLLRRLLALDSSLSDLFTEAVGNDLYPLPPPSPPAPVDAVV